jgi:outer membrane protein TolC
MRLADQPPIGCQRAPRADSPARSLTLLACTSAALLAGCASLPPEAAFADAADWSQRAQAPAPQLADTPERWQALQDRRQVLLAAPLTQAAAVEVALATSPAAQTLLAEGWQLQSATAAGGTLPGFTLSFERMVHGAEEAWKRSISFGLAELITWPARRAAADTALQAQRLQLAQQMLAMQTAVRSQWVRAVAARQLLEYHRQVQDTADAATELARRMQAVGNFSRLQRAREQVFAGDAATRRIRAEQEAVAETEALVRLLGLEPGDAARLQLPDRLPDLPAAPRDAATVAAAALSERLDLRIAADQLAAAGRAEGVSTAALFDLELELARERSSGGERARSTELALTLPLPDTAALRSQGAGAATLAAAHRLQQARVDASSTLRERHSATRSAHAVAVQWRDELLPLRRTITDESLLKYNGMLVGVFELLAEARAQVAAVIAAIEAQRDFWLAEAALDATILGAPALAPTPSAGPAPAAQAKGH